MFKAAQYGKRSSQVNHSTKEGEWNTLGEYFFTADFCGYHTFFLDRFSGKCPNPFFVVENRPIWQWLFSKQAFPIVVGG